MAAVLQVITALEGIQITKEQLEATRLGKYINHLRRKTTNESLARRSKNLLKKWREMVLPSAGSATASAATQSSSTSQNNASAQTKQTIQSKQITSSGPASLAASTAFQPTKSPVNGYGMPAAQQPQPPSLPPPSRAPPPINYQHKTQSDGLQKNANGNKKSSIGGHDTSPSAVYNRKFGANQISNISNVDDCINVQSNSFSTIDDSHRKANAKQKNNAYALQNITTAAPSADPYRFLQQNDGSKSPVSISALPKIPKKKSSSAIKDAERSERLYNAASGPPSQPPSKFSAPSSSIQTQKYFQCDAPPHIKPVNGRDENFYSVNETTPPPPQNTTFHDSNSNSSFRDQIVASVSEPKKKHKKHKKEKKKKRQSSPPPPPTVANKFANDGCVNSIETSPIAAPAALELPDSLSSSSVSLFNSTNNSMKPTPPIVSGKSAGGGSVGGGGVMRNVISPADLTFSGKFSKTDDTVINIDSSSCSNSPKYAKFTERPERLERPERPERSRSPVLLAPSRSTSPARTNKTAANSRSAFNDESLSQLNRPQNMLANNFVESLSQVGCAGLLPAFEAPF